MGPTKCRLNQNYYMCIVCVVDIITNNGIMW